MNPDAIVIGGGFAGLAAATALAEQGARVLVLEARPGLGGRASAFTDPATGERVDNGQHVLFGCYHQTFRFLRRIGAESALRLQPQLAIGVVDREGRASRLACPSLPPPLHLAVGVLRWNALGWRDRIAVLGIRRAVSRARSDETVRQWLVRHGQTPRLIELLWEPLAVAALNQSIEVAAAPPFARVLRDLFGGDPRDAALAMPIVPLDELYALPAKAYIEARGGEVRTGAQATVVCGSPSAVARVRVRDLEIEAGIVVCAVPWHALSGVIENATPGVAAVLRNAEATAASPIVTVNLWLDRAVTDEPFIGLPGRTMQWLFDKRMLIGARASHLSLVSSGADAVVGLTNEELVGLATAEVRDALPRAREAVVLRALVVREKRASFSVAPGQPPRPATRTDVRGLFLAGDWIDTGLPATIEGAVIGGHAAAEAALLLS